MARVKTRHLTWTASPSADVVEYEVYADNTKDANFLANVDAGSVAPIGVTAKDVLEYPLGPGSLAEGTWQFAVTAKDNSDNYSDPYQSSAWVNVPLDLTAPLPPSAGGLA